MMNIVEGIAGGQREVMCDAIDMEKGGRSEMIARSNYQV